MATHSSILAWRIPWTEEPGGLQAMGSHRVILLLVLFIEMPAGLILMKAMFNSVTLHYKLMSNIGLTAKTAYGSVALMMLIYTLIGELVGMLAIIALNSSGFSYVVSIFKYIDFGTAALLVLAHFALCALSLLSVYKSLKNQIFNNISLIPGPPFGPS